MSLGSKFNRRVGGCLFKLILFVAMVVAFIVLIFFVFSGLTYFLEGETLDVPELPKVWNFVSDSSDEFFQAIDNSLDDIPDITFDEIMADGEATDLPTDTDVVTPEADAAADTETAE